jgi:hypothetical protein
MEGVLQMSTTPRTDSNTIAGTVILHNGQCTAQMVSSSFARQLETELTAARSERDLAITRVASILWSGAIDKRTCGDVQQWADDYTAELTRLRDENKLLRTAQKISEDSDGAIVMEVISLRADRTYNHECINRLASATGTLGERSEKVVDIALSTIDRLRAEVERLNDCCDELHYIIDNGGYPSGKDYAAMQARAEKAEADTARLDWLDKNGREHGGYGPMWRISWEYGQPDTLRAVIDAAMKETSK